LSKLRAEIDSIVGLGQFASQITRDDLKKMSYLALIIKEVLRLYPSVPINSRAARKTTTLPVGGGPDGKLPVLVQKGEVVGYCVYAMHRRKSLYGDDAHEFRPERWEEDGLKDIGYGYLPVSAR
jgi:cytochrome P450